MATYRVLALDGGGVCGLVTAHLLRRLHERCPRFLDAVDLIAGTSSGGLIALALAHRLNGTPASIAATLKEICAIFESGKDTFGRPRFWWAGRRGVHFLSLFSSKYRSDSRRATVERFFGPSRLADLYKNVLIASFDLDKEEKGSRSWSPKLFHNLPHATVNPMRWDRNDDDALAWKVAMYTSAAPIFFPSFEGYIDGGVYSNNPTMCALAQALDPRYHAMGARRADPEPRNPELAEILLLSIGAGLSLKYLPGSYRWGAAGWALPTQGNLVKLVTDGTVGIADYQCEQLLRDHYLRIQPTFEQDVEIALDGIEHIPFIKYFAETCPISAETVDWINQHWIVGLPILAPFTSGV